MHKPTCSREDQLTEDSASLSLRSLSSGTVLATVICVLLFIFSIKQNTEVSDIVFTTWILSTVSMLGSRYFVIFNLKNKIITEGIGSTLLKKINLNIWLFGISDGLIWSSVNWFIFSYSLANEYLGISLTLGAITSYGLIYLFSPKVAVTASALATTSSLAFLYSNIGAISYQFIYFVIPFGCAILFFQATLGQYILKSIKKANTHELAALTEKEANFNFNQHWRNTPLAAIEWNEKFVITRWNPSAESIFGFNAEEAIGKSLELIFLQKDIHSMKQKWRSTWRNQKGQRSVNSCINKDGNPVHCQWHDSDLRINSVPSGITSFVEDISVQVESEAAIKNQANYDNLTGLPNRRQMMIKIDEAVGRARQTREFSALIFLDLDHFKDINDTQGHDVGDIVLQEFGKKLKPLVRQGDTVSRFGGDEFVILLEGLGNTHTGAEKSSQLIADKLLSAGENLCKLKGITYDVDVSGGIALFDGNVTSVGDILKSADLAMYQVKQNGRKGICFYDQSLSLEAEYRVEVLRSLRGGLKNGEFELYSQAIVDCQGNIRYFENLLRWQRGGTQMVLASDFIDILANSPMIVPVGYWVFESACENINKLRKQELWDDNGACFINVSPKQLLDKDFENRVKDILKENDIDPRWVVIEITEESLIDNYEDAISQLKNLVDYGFRFALDDFGTGYSSLALLKDLPIAFLKLDKEFIRNLEEDRNDNLIVQAIITLCDIMSLEVIAEGVETKEQFDLLNRMGCDYIQGYYPHRPMAFQEFSTYIEPNKSEQKSNIYKFKKS